MQLSNHKSSAAGAKGIIFPKLECWNPMDESATIAAEVDKQRVLCRVSLKVLKDKFGGVEEAPMSYVARHRVEIQAAARKLIEKKAYGEDGSITIRKQDL